MTGYRPAHLDPRPDLVVVGNVCRKDNPEARAAIDGGLPTRSMPGRSSELFLASGPRSWSAGTHGKTTTTALVAVLLTQSARTRACSSAASRRTSTRASASGGATRPSCRGRRVRLGLLREDAEVLGVRPVGRDPHLARARPHRHLPRRELPRGLRIRARASPRTACSSPRGRSARARGREGRAVPRGLLRALDRRRRRGHARVDGGAHRCERRASSPSSSSSAALRRATCSRP
jgi:hypothetical protein